MKIRIDRTIAYTLLDIAAPTIHSTLMNRGTATTPGIERTPIFTVYWKQ